MDNVTLASLLALAVGLVKVIEKFIDWGMKKFNGEKHNVVVQLDPQASAALVEILRRTEKIEDLVTARDGDGVPLVYFPRSQFHDMVARQRATLDKVDELRDYLERK